jgi:uncharacterized membrane protein YoaK (UPF0700 family)
MLATASALWIVVVGFYFLLTGGTYGYATSDGTMVCGVPIFTSESWFQASLVLFGVPLAVFVAGVVLRGYCHRRLPYVSLK